MPNFLLVMAGGAIGAGFRWHLSRIALQLLGPAFPWGTWIVNLLGSLLLGLLAGVVVRHGPSGEPLLLFLGVGVLGGFTTFSGFSLEMVQMLERGNALLAVAYAVSSVAGSVMLLIVGLWLARAAA
ncbi:fluoride efflux transporter CrcB [Sphingosinicella humi]|uniref:Fluoride-specific ion channel FluC n=1 Tax=Allosphingosinicella humi TaxID=2068657 RepID=A0A2U2J3R1_9SPHN|nr:fluoride efflux transporter CrcB [Sphingosinicella humi]PWG02954.1 fluoride efflux transporter CrcB [Sphingosinicella humi]